MADKPVAKKAAPTRGATGKTGAAGVRGRTGTPGARGRTGKQAVTPDAYLLKADALQVSLDAVRAEMARQTDEIDAANKTADDANASATRAKWASRLALVGVILSLVGVGLSWSAIIAIEDARADAQYTDCLRANDVSEKAVAKERKSAQVIIAAARRVPVELFHTIKLDDREAGYIRDQVAGARDIYPPRKCTPEAIADYHEADKP